jgi:hypothetical protein
LSGKAPDGCSAAAVVSMAVVPFKRARRGRRLFLRHYICTDAGLFRITNRLARDIAHGEVAVPQFANSVQRTVEVFVERVAGKISCIQIRPTHAHFGSNGKADLGYAAETMALILEGSVAKNVYGSVWDITPTLKTKKRERETQWRLPQSIKRSILADITGKATLPLLRHDNLLKVF